MSCESSDFSEPSANFSRLRCIACSVRLRFNLQAVFITCPRCETRFRPQLALLRDQGLSIGDVFDHSEVDSHVAVSVLLSMSSSSDRAESQTPFINSSRAVLTSPPESLDQSTAVSANVHSAANSDLNFRGLNPFLPPLLRPHISVQVEDSHLIFSRSCCQHHIHVQCVALSVVSLRCCHRLI